MQEPLVFSAAVERPLSLAHRDADGHWEGHDYTVEVVASRKGLDAFDVVVDFRDLEAALDALLRPLQGCLLEEQGLASPLDLARRLAAELTPRVPAPARLAQVALRDGRGRALRIHL